MRSMSATMVVTVLLPLEPVMATTGVAPDGAGEQLDVTAHRNMRRHQGLLERGLRERYARAHDDVVQHACESLSGKPAEGNSAPRETLRCTALTGRAATAGCPPPSRGDPFPVSQMTHTGKPGLAETHHQSCFAGSDIGVFDPVSQLCPLTVIIACSANLQGSQPDHYQNHGDDPEANDDPGFRPALELEVMMQRRHAENALAGQLERRHLQDHRNGFHHEHAAHDQEHQLLACDHRHHTQGRAQCEGSDVAHEHLGGISVEPQETRDRRRQWNRRRPPPRRLPG